MLPVFEQPLVHRSGQALQHLSRHRPLRAAMRAVRRPPQLLLEVVPSPLISRRAITTVSRTPHLRPAPTTRFYGRHAARVSKFYDYSGYMFIKACRTTPQRYLGAGEGGRCLGPAPPGRGESDPHPLASLAPKGDPIDNARVHRGLRWLSLPRFLAAIMPRVAFFHDLHPALILGRQTDWRGRLPNTRLNASVLRCRLT